jgi:hypothetical protein
VGSRRRHQAAAAGCPDRRAFGLTCGRLRGALTVAYALASFHQRFTGRIAAVATPLEAAQEPLDATVATWLLSASGGNIDIMTAAKALIGREPRQLAVLCGREDSALVELCRSHSFVDLLLYPPPAGKDGFLATNSLLGFTALLARAYATEFDGEKEWADAVAILQPLLHDRSEAAAWEVATAPLWSRPTILREPHALGVDEISVDPTTCWNLAQPGQRGPAATLEYLSSLNAHNGPLRFFEEALE